MKSTSIASFDDRSRTVQFWRYGAPAVARVRARRLLPRTEVMHASMDNMYRPMAQIAFRTAHSSGVPTVFVGPDMDLHEVWKDQLGTGPLAGADSQTRLRAGRSTGRCRATSPGRTSRC